MECAAQVHVEYGVEVGVRHVLQRTAADVSRVVDQDVDAAVAVERGADDGLSPSAVATESVEATAAPPAARISSTTCWAGPSSTPHP